MFLHLSHQVLRWIFLVSQSNYDVLLLKRIVVNPLSIQILRQEQALVVGHPRTVDCEVKGARPVPDITWWKEGIRLENSQSKV